MDYYRWKILNYSDIWSADSKITCLGGSYYFRKKFESMLTEPEVQKTIEREQKRMEDFQKKYNINLTITVTKTPPQEK